MRRRSINQKFEFSKFYKTLIFPMKSRLLKLHKVYKNKIRVYKNKIANLDPFLDVNELIRTSPNVETVL